MSRVALWISSVRPLGGVRAISLCHRVDANKLLATTTLLLHDNNDSNHFHLDNQAYTFPLVPSLTGMLPLVTNGTWRVFPSLSLRGRSSTLTFSPAAIDYHHDPSLFYCFQTYSTLKYGHFLQGAVCEILLQTLSITSCQHPGNIQRDYHHVLGSTCRSATQTSQNVLKMFRLVWTHLTCSISCSFVTCEQQTLENVQTQFCGHSPEFMSEKKLM